MGKFNTLRQYFKTGVTSTEMEILDGATVTTAELNKLDGATVTTAELNKLDGVTSTTAELNLVDNMPSTVTIAAAAGGANVSEVTYTVKDAAGSTIAGVFTFDVFLSDAATGAGLTATSASGTVTVKSASGAVIGTDTSKKALRIQTLATGVFILEITDSAKTQFYPCAVMTSTGATVVGTQLETADYGS
jgi:hypothetical protein